MLEVISLSFEYFDKPLFKRIELKVNEGQLCHIKGKNGVGKTTLLKLIAGLLMPSEGEIRYKTQNILYSLAYQQAICYIGNKMGISAFLTVKENCELNCYERQETSDSIKRLLKAFKLEHMAEQRCMHLSLGQRQRVGLLRLATTKASLWLLDEPFAALDQEAVRRLMILFKSHLKRGGQIILTSHQEIPLNWHNSISYYLHQS